MSFRQGKWKKSDAYIINLLHAIYILEHLNEDQRA